MARHLAAERPVSIVFAVPDHPWTRASRDAAAVRIVWLLRAALANAREAGSRLAATTADYLVAENPMLVSRAEMVSLAEQVTRLRDDVERPIGGLDARAAAAEGAFAVGKSVIRLRWEQLGALPAALAETLPFVSREEGSVAVVCQGTRCLPPVRSVEALGQVLGE